MKLRIQLERAQRVARDKTRLHEALTLAANALDTEFNASRDARIDGSDSLILRDLLDDAARTLRTQKKGQSK